MARTSRGAGPSNVDALDSLNIDDIFAEGSDALFDGLDMDLGHMAELTADVDDGKLVKNGHSVEKPATSVSGPPSTSAVETDASKRRKTKRKAKSPALLDDDDVTIEMDAKKKRRISKAPPSKSRTSTPKGSKKQPEAAGEPLPAISGLLVASTGSTAASSVSVLQNNNKSKKKSKPGAATTMPPPLGRNASIGGGPATVAAAGQFGGRQRRGGQFSLPMQRVTTERQKAKAKAAESTKVTSTQGRTTGDTSSSLLPQPSVGQANRALQPPLTTAAVPTDPVTASPDTKRENTFCGLHPSNHLFYPFMPMLPAEPSMKNRPKLPLIERIHVALTNQINAPASEENELPAGELNGIYRLILDSLEQAPSALSNVNSIPPEKRAALIASVSSVLKVVAGLDKGRLSLDLFSLCAMLKRQHDFLKQSLSNMEVWCKENFSEQDFAQTYGVVTTDVVGSKKKKPPLETFTPLLTGLPSPFIRVKIRCIGFKEPKVSTPLTAMLPPSAVAAGATTTAIKKEPVKPPSKKRKAAAPPDTATSADVAHIFKQPDKILPYSMLPPTKRRQRISEAISRKSELLEAKIREAEQGRRQLLQRRQTELQKFADDEEAVIHTTAMWQWIEKSSFFAPFTEDDVRELLRTVWTPEGRKPDFSRSPLETQVTQYQNHLRQHQSQVVADSLYERLHSLLVDESGAHEDDEEDENDDDTIIRIWHDLPEQVISTKKAALDKFDDVADLSLDERTYIVLHTVGLIDSSVPPPLPPAADAIDGNDHSNAEMLLRPNDEMDELQDLLVEMSDDLNSLCSVNNKRAAFLQATAKAYLETREARKKKAEDDNYAITKCMQVLKKNKDSKSKNSRRSGGVKKDDDWMPW